MDNHRRHIAVGRWSDIESAPDLTDREKQRVAAIFTDQSWDHIVWVPEWLLADAEKTLETVESSDHIAVGNIEDYSEKAWSFEQRHLHKPVTESGEEYLPKSAVVVFERVRGVEIIETPQAGLTSFTGGDDGE